LLPWKNAEWQVHRKSASLAAVRSTIHKAPSAWAGMQER
jgi:hypothetical protein